MRQFIFGLSGANLGIDSKTWLAMVGQLPLSRVEKEVLRRFEEDPSGRQFLPLSDVLRNHKLHDESLELLAQGVQNHPSFSVARVVLVRELFQRGQVLEAWSTLEHSTQSLTDNILAQKLRFKMAILLGDEVAARSAMQLLRIQQGVDPESRKLFDQLEIDGVKSVRDFYRDDLQRKGVDLKLPETHLSVADDGQATKRRGADLLQADNVVEKGRRFILEYELDANTKKYVENFHVVPLAEIFLPGDDAASGTESAQEVELDSTTLAEIYAKQGIYSKALAVYRRLLRMAPHNDLIRLKVAEMARLEKEQRSEDLESDPVVFERMEVSDLIDRQTRFMQNLLDKLDQGER